MFKSYYPEFPFYKIMLISESQLTTVDNSGIKVVKCVKFLKGRGSKVNKVGSLGGVATVSVRDIDFSLKLDKKKTYKKIYEGLIVSVVQWIRRKVGIFIKSSLNQILLLDGIDKFLGNSIKGPIALEIKKYKNYTKNFFMINMFY